MAMNHEQLRALCLADPRGYGFRARIGIVHGGDLVPPGSTQYKELTEMWNEVRDGTNKPANPTADGGQASGIISLTRPDIASSEISQVFDLDDMKATPGAPELQWFNGLIIAPYPWKFLNEDGTDTPVMKNILFLLKPGVTGTKTRLQAISRQISSYGAEKFGFGLMVNIDDMIRAIGSY